MYIPPHSSPTHHQSMLCCGDEVAAWASTVQVLGAGWGVGGSMCGGLWQAAEI